VQPNHGSRKGEYKETNTSNHMSSKKVVRSALCMIPPESTWKPIQAIRAKHDKAYDRWMPHVNLLYPFYEDASFADVHSRLGREFGSQPDVFGSFTVTLSRFGFFQHGKNSFTVFLHVETSPRKNGLTAVQTGLERLFPDCNDLSQRGSEGFKAHLTVGQWKSEASMKKAIADFEKSWKPIVFELKELALISRSDSDQSDPFHVRYTVPLVKALGSGDYGAPAVPVPIVLPNASLSRQENKKETKSVNFQVSVAAASSASTSYPSIPVPPPSSIAFAAPPPTKVTWATSEVKVSAVPNKPQHLTSRPMTAGKEVASDRRVLPRSTGLVTPVAVCAFAPPTVDIAPVSMFRDRTRVTPLTPFTTGGASFRVAPVSFVTPSVATVSRQPRV